MFDADARAILRIPLHDPHATESCPLLNGRFIECTHIALPNQTPRSNLTYATVCYTATQPLLNSSTFPDSYISCRHDSSRSSPYTHHPPLRNLPIRPPFRFSTSPSDVVQFPSGPMKYPPSRFVFAPSPSRCIEVSIDSVEALAAAASDPMAPLPVFRVMTLAALEFASGTIYSEGARMDPASDSAIVSRSNGRVLTRPGRKAGAMRGFDLNGNMGRDVLDGGAFFGDVSRSLTTFDGGIGEIGDEASSLDPSVCEKSKPCTIGLPTDELDSPRMWDGFSFSRGLLSLSSMMTSSGFVGSGH